MRYLYHVASWKNTARIEEEGLRGHEFHPIWDHHGRSQPRGNYGYEYLSHARRYADIVVERPAYSGDLPKGMERFQIWRFDTTDLWVMYDPESLIIAGPKEYNEDCVNKVCKHNKFAYPRWYTDEWVSPERMNKVSMEEIKDCDEGIIETFCYNRDKMEPLPDWEETMVLQAVA